jgi:hypothetical protein
MTGGFAEKLAMDYLDDTISAQRFDTKPYGVLFCGKQSRYFDSHDICGMPKEAGA